MKRALWIVTLAGVLLGMGYTPLRRPVALTLQERFGVEVVSQKGDVGNYAVGRLHAGWYQDVGASLTPARPAGMEYVQLVRVAGTSYRPDLTTVGAIVDANPGSLWLIGNEPDQIWQDNTEPGQYAALYHELYAFIKGRDPTAQVSMGGIVQATPLRMQYLDMVLAAYQERYGAAPPVDVWNIHAMILREERGSWGSEIPPGIELPSTVWVVGDQGVTWGYDPATGARPITRPRRASGAEPTNALHDVAGFSRRDVWAVGDRGTILHYDGAAWDPQASGTTDHLYGVAAYFPYHVWAVGDHGRILYFDGSTWVTQSSPTEKALLDVAIRSPTDVWAVGQDGTILHYDGSSWSAHSSATASDLRGVSAYAAHTVWAVGDGGVILRFNGTGWQAEAGGTAEALHAVSGYSPSNVWAVGDGGTILHYDGTIWSPQASGTKVNLHGVAAYSPEHVWAVGDNGTILYYDGITWSTAGADSPSGIAETGLLSVPLEERPPGRSPDRAPVSMSDYYSVAYVPQRMLYEIQDNDDIEIFKGQMRAFRRWMKAHGQRNKPLIISEYGVLMPVLYGFDHSRLKAFMYASFDYMLNTADAELGYPADDNRLVQRWAWYSLNDQPWDPVTGEGFNGNLFDPATGQITPLGEDYAAYIMSHIGCGTVAADVNCDCTVDIDDVVVIASLWRTASDDLKDHPEYDADGDGDIDVVDIMWVATRWGNTCG